MLLSICREYESSFVICQAHFAGLLLLHPAVEDGCRHGKQAWVLGTLHTKESEGCNVTQLLCQMTCKIYSRTVGNP